MLVNSGGAERAGAVCVVSVLGGWWVAVWGPGYGHKLVLTLGVLGAGRRCLARSVFSSQDLDTRGLTRS